MELAIGLVGALIGAAAVVAAQIVSGRTSLRAAKAQQRRVDIATATRSLMQVLQAQQWLVWKARHDQSGVGEKELTDYESAANAGLARVAGDLGVLAATWPDVYHRFGPLAATVMTYDNEMGLAIVECRRDLRAGLARMDRLYENVLRFHWYVYAQTERIVDGQDVQKYNPAAWKDPDKGQ